MKPTVRPKTHYSCGELERRHFKPDLVHHQLGKLTLQHVHAVMSAKAATDLFPRTAQ